MSCSRYSIGRRVKRDFSLLVSPVVELQLIYLTKYGHYEGAGVYVKEENVFCVDVPYNRRLPAMVKLAF